MTENNLYAAPKSDLNVVRESTGRRTIEESLEQGYDFEIGDVITQAWEAVKGFKLPLLLAGIIVFVIMMVIAFVAGFLPAPVAFAIEFVFNIISFCFLGGFAILTLNHLRQKQVSLTDSLFGFTPMILALAVAYIVVSLFTMIGFILLILPGIYLATAYSLVAWIIVDNPHLSFWQAMEASRKLITQHWFKVFFTTLIVGVIFTLSAFTIVGLFWTFPLAMLTQGIMYQYMIGERRSATTSF